MATRKGTDVITTERYQSDRYDVELTFAPPAVPHVKIMRRSGSSTRGSTIFDHYLKEEATDELIELLEMVREDIKNA